MVSLQWRFAAWFGQAQEGGARFMAGTMGQTGVVFIYGLTDPRTGQLRYVGRTIRELRARLNNHIASAREASDRHVNCWIRGLLASGLKPEMILLEEAGAATWEEAETFWIEYWRWLGADLTNLAIGGSGSMGFRHRPEALERFKLRSGQNHYAWGKKRPPEVHAAMAAGRVRYQATNPHPMLGTKRAPETLAKISAARKGKPVNLTDEGRRAKEEGMKRRWADPDQRAAHLERMTGANNPNFRKTKLTDDQVRELRRLHASGQMKVPDLAAKFNVSLTLAYNIVAGRTMAHVG
jgi:hypothetical protein